MRRTSTLAGSVLLACTSLILSGCENASNRLISTDRGLVTLTQIGRFETGDFDESSAEIVAFDPTTDRAYVINSNDATVDILDISTPAAPTQLGTIDVSGDGDAPNSVDVFNGVIAVAVERNDTTDDSIQLAGSVVFYSAVDAAAPVRLGSAPAGALPDMLTFTPDGSAVLVANEGEPNDDYDVDPDGSITHIDVSGGFDNAPATQITFSAFDSQADALRAASVRIFGPGATVSQDLEPEYIAVAPDGQTAYVALQENNAFATVDLTSLAITRITPLGFKDYNATGLDASNRDDAINIQTWPVLGMYQPDAIAAFVDAGVTYIATANEGDARDYDGYSEEFRIGDDEITLDPNAFPNANLLKNDENLGRLRITSALGAQDASGCDAAANAGDPTGCTFDTLYAYGGRSFSIFTTDGALVWDSGDDFEQLTANLIPDGFNASNDENDVDDRSDDKGPEPEAIAIGMVGGHRFAFIGLERVGGIMVYRINDPATPVFVTYLNNRDFSADQATLEAGDAGDLGPEHIEFVPADLSPNGAALLLVGNEVSGTTAIYRVDLQ